MHRTPWSGQKTRSGDESGRTSPVEARTGQDPVVFAGLSAVRREKSPSALEGRGTRGRRAPEHRAGSCAARAPRDPAQRRSDELERRTSRADVNRGSVQGSLPLYAWMHDHQPYPPRAAVRGLQRAADPCRRHSAQQSRYDHGVVRRACRQDGPVRPQEPVCGHGAQHRCCWDATRCELTTARLADRLNAASRASTRTTR